MRRCWTSQLTSDRRRHGHRHTEALAEPCSALRLCCHAAQSDLREVRPLSVCQNDQKESGLRCSTSDRETAENGESQTNGGMEGFGWLLAFRCGQNKKKYLFAVDGEKYKEIISFRFCLQFAFYDREKSRFRFLELWAEPTKGGRKHPNLSLVGVSALVKRVVWGTGEERVRDRRTERQMDWKMIYPDLGSTLRTAKGGKRGEVAVVMGKGERINVLTTMED